MKNFLSVMAVSISSFLAMTAYGHEGHDHGPVSIKSALEISVQTAKSYSSTPSPFIGLLPASWSTLSKSNARIHENKLGYYVVALNNPHENKTIYFKILLDGTIEDANFSGNFAEMSAGSSSKSKSGG